MAVGPDEMVDLEFLQDRTDKWSASGASGIDFVKRGESAKRSDERSAYAAELQRDKPVTANGQLFVLASAALRRLRLALGHSSRVM